MSIASTIASITTEAPVSESRVRIRFDGDKISNKINPPERALLASAQPANFMAVSTEELTFQFSEAAEAKESALEARLMREQEIKEKSFLIKIEEVHAIMKLMEGKAGYEVLRGQARGFASLYAREPEGALKQLDLGNISAERKYALLTMAFEALAVTKDHANAHDSLFAHILKQHNPLQERSQLQMFALKDKKGDLALKQGDNLTQAISMQPSVNIVWDLINERYAGNLFEALERTRIEWRKSNISIVENVAAFVILHKIMAVIQSMYSDTEQFLMRIGALDLRKTDLTLKYTRLLIDLAHSSMPSTLIEKILSSLKSIKRRCSKCISRHRFTCENCSNRSKDCICIEDIKCQCADCKTFYLSLLHFHARRWPHSIWITPDAKNLVLDQLLKKQNAPTGLQAKRMMRQ